MALSKENNNSFKTFIIISSTLLLLVYIWMNFYVLYSKRIPGNFYIMTKKRAKGDIFFVNMDNIFPKKQNNIDSLMKGLNWLETHKDLKQALEKKGLDKKFY